MAHRVEILEDVQVFIGRGLLAYRKGWKGPVKAEAHAKLMKSGKAKDTTPPAKEPKADTKTKKADKEDDGSRAAS